jgi:hypothetical protein
MRLTKSPRRFVSRSFYLGGRFRWLTLFLTLLTAALVGVVAASACSCFEVGNHRFR